jgi:hypothetical protein
VSALAVARKPVVARGWPVPGARMGSARQPRSSPSPQEAVSGKPVAIKAG